MKKKILAAVVLLSIGLSTQAQTILQARATAVGGTVTIKGIVLNGSELGSIRYVQDATAGVSIYGTNLSTVKRGDSIVATGKMTNYNNLAEITPISSFTVAASGKPSPTPIAVTPSQFSDTYEGELVSIDSVKFSGGGGTFAGNTNYTFTRFTQTGTVRVALTSQLVGKFIPTSMVDLTGILSQFCSSPVTGCTSGYQLLLRDSADITTTTISLINQPYPTNISTTGMDINWNTNLPGSSFIKYGLTPNLELGTLTGVGGSTAHLVSITGATAATIYYAQVFSVAGTDTAKSQVKVFCTRSNSSGTINVYFNKTVDNSVSTGTNAIYLNNLVDDTLIAYINRAKSTMDIAIYNWDNSSSSNITTAVNAAYARGVRVRIIFDGSTSQTGLQTLNPSIKNMASPQGANYTIMHNKFVIIDANSVDPNDPIVWTGSTNWTSQQLSTDANNVIVFQDQSLARGYKLEFDEMWGDTSVVSNPNFTARKFGQFKTNNTPHEYIIGGKRVEQYFSPSDGTNSHVISSIGTANTDLYFGLLNITRSDVADKINSQVKANSLLAKGIVDDTASAGGLQFLIMKGAMGSNIKVDKYSWLFHHKYLIVDPSNTSSDPLVLTGSHNWSTAAETKNDENTVIVHDATIANIYLQEFTQRWSDELTGINTLNSSKFSLIIYPNPNSGQYQLSYSLEKHERVTVKMYDLTGRMIYTQLVSGSEGENTISMNQTQLAKGVYIVELSNGTEREMKKLVIE